MIIAYYYVTGFFKRNDHSSEQCDDDVVDIVTRNIHYYFITTANDCFHIRYAQAEGIYSLKLIAMDTKIPKIM